MPPERQRRPRSEDSGSAVAIHSDRTPDVDTAAIDAKAAQRRADLIRREWVHLECPRCNWIVLPPEGLLIDRSIRLVSHLADCHEWEYDFLRIAMQTVDRALVEGKAAA